MSWFLSTNGESPSIFSLKQKAFVNQNIIYLTGLIQIASIQIYILDSLQSEMDTSFLDGRILDAEDILMLTNTPDWSANYDSPNKTIQITLPSTQSGVVLYREFTG